MALTTDCPVRDTELLGDLRISQSVPVVEPDDSSVFRAQSLATVRHSLDQLLPLLLTFRPFAVGRGITSGQVLEEVICGKGNLLCPTAGPDRIKAEVAGHGEDP